MRSQSFTTATIALLALGFLAGCASSSDNTALREPGFRASTIRRIPEDYQAALVEGLDRLGILAVDVAVAPSSRSRALDGIDRASALTRAREAGAENLVIVDARLARGDLRHCTGSGRSLIGPTTYWDAALEIDRVSDGKPLLLEPPSEELRAVDVELDCKTGRLIRRRSMDELINDSVRLVLEPFSSR